MVDAEDRICPYINGVCVKEKCLCYKSEWDDVYTIYYKAVPLSENDEMVVEEKAKTVGRLFKKTVKVTTSRPKDETEKKTDLYTIGTVHRYRNKCEKNGIVFGFEYDCTIFSKVKIETIDNDYHWLGHIIPRECHPLGNIHLIPDQKIRERFEKAIEGLN